MNFLKSTVFIFFAVLIFSCSKKDTTAPKSSLNSIKSFVITSTTPNVSGVIDTVAHTVKLTMPIGTDATSLIPTITVSPLATISPATGVKQDFSKNVTYTVTSENGTVAPYTVTTTVQKSSENAMLTFAFAGLNPAVSGVLDAAGTTVNVTVPSGTNVKTLVPTITISPRATISPLTGIAQDFTNAVPYIITAENGTTRTVNVKVSVASVTGTNQTVYVGGSSGYLYALNANTGTKKFATYSFGSYDSPIVANGSIFCGDSYKTFWAIDTLVGNVKWKISTDSRFTSSPVIANGIVYVGGVDGYKLFAFDASTGATKWTFSTGGTIRETPIVSNGIVYFGSNNNKPGSNGDKIYALDATTGAVIWTFDTKDYAASVTSAFLDNGVLYIADDSWLFALDASTGVQKWKFEVSIQGLNIIFSDPFVSNGVVYFGSTDYYLYALNTTDGSVKWKFKGENIFEASPVVSNNVVYIGNDANKLYAIDATTGTKKWEFGTGDIVTSTPTVANGIVYFGSYDNYVYAVDASLGTKKWSSKINGVVITSPCVVAKEGVYRGLGNIHP